MNNTTVKRIVEAIDEFLQEQTEKNKFAYHVTRKNNLASIKKTGIEPRVPLDFGDAGDTKGVYLFNTLVDVEDALQNWLGERIEEWELNSGEQYNEILLKINISGLEDCFTDTTAEYELVCTRHIDPSRIIDIIKI